MKRLCWSLSGCHWVLGGNTTLGSDVSLELVLMAQERVCLLVLHEVCPGGFFPSCGAASE